MQETWLPVRDLTKYTEHSFDYPFVHVSYQENSICWPEWSYKNSFTILNFYTSMRCIQQTVRYSFWNNSDREQIKHHEDTLQKTF